MQVTSCPTIVQIPGVGVAEAGSEPGGDGVGEFDTGVRRRPELVKSIGVAEGAARLGTDRRRLW